ncbi:MAG: hypothetical protein R3320_12825 [Nitriliruptorales bacterium]|nr:hypothetical protein [Nitriliruptorales bacterium]
MSWLQTVDRLSRTVATELADAHRQRQQLLAEAHAVAHYAIPPHSPAEPGDRPSVGCVARRCAFEEVEGGAALCALVLQLERIEPDVRPARAAIVDVDHLVRRFMSALSGCMDAVRYCRLMEHPAGRCWFATNGSQPGCGEVLRLAHQVGP